jgi:transcriptional regulator with XRE-family HTH domain
LPEADSAVPDTNETIGARIRRLRTSAGLSQSELATAAGVTKAAISQWETGNVSNLKAVNLIALAHAFEVSAEEVWSGMPAKAGPTALADIPPRRLDLIRAYGRLPDAWRKPIRMMIESLDASIDPKRRAFEADRARASEVIRRSGKARDKAPT